MFANSDELLDRAYYDKSFITDELRAEYAAGSEMRDWDRALWEYVIARRDSSDLDVSSSASRIDCPVLVVTGAEDEIVPAESSRRAAAILDGSSYAEIPACGHLAFQETPREFLAIALPWLASIDTAR
jgi:pimeloyl-ACP methyl ester carboxylesterase